MGRKVAAATAMLIGLACAIIFALGVAGILPGVNAQYPNLGLVLGAVFFGIGGCCLGCVRSRRPFAFELTDALSPITKLK